MLKLACIFSILLIGFTSCQNTEQRQKKILSEKELREPLIGANKKAVATENQQINDFIARYNWDMVETGTGLQYYVYEIGEGEKASEGRIAVFEYEVRLLNGDVIYSSQQSGVKEFMIGRGGVESGLEEGILLMKVGDRAKFILPSHLAFGLLGDRDKISTKTTLVYDLKLLELK